MLGAGPPLISHEKDLRPNQISPKHIVAGQETILHGYTCTDAVAHSRKQKNNSILFSLWGIASMAVNPVTVGSRYNYKCCLHSAAAHLLLKHWWWEVYGARCEKGELCPERSRRGKQSIWLALSPEWDHGIALEQPLGAAAVSADRTQPHVAPSTNTAFYWQ